MFLKIFYEAQDIICCLSGLLVALLNPLLSLNVSEGVGNDGKCKMSAKDENCIGKANDLKKKKMWGGGR